MENQKQTNQQEQDAKVAFESLKQAKQQANEKASEHKAILDEHLKEVIAGFKHVNADVYLALENDENVVTLIMRNGMGVSVTAQQLEDAIKVADEGNYGYFEFLTCFISRPGNNGRSIVSRMKVAKEEIALEVRLAPDEDVEIARHAQAIVRQKTQIDAKGRVGDKLMGVAEMLEKMIKEHPENPDNAGAAAEQPESPKD